MGRTLLELSTTVAKGDEIESIEDLVIHVTKLLSDAIVAVDERKDASTLDIRMSRMAWDYALQNMYGLVEHAPSGTMLHNVYYATTIARLRVIESKVLADVREIVSPQEECPRATKRSILNWFVKTIE
jgi:hypothetical protein